MVSLGVLAAIMAGEARCVSDGDVYLGYNPANPRAQQNRYLACVLVRSGLLQWFAWAVPSLIVPWTEVRTGRRVCVPPPPPPRWGAERRALGASATSARQIASLRATTEGVDE